MDFNIKKFTFDLNMSKRVYKGLEIKSSNFIRTSLTIYHF